MADLAFASLTKGSAKTGSFLARVLHSNVSSWEYQSKITGQTRRGHKFECYLVGEDAKEYCIGFALRCVIEYSRQTILQLHLLEELHEFLLLVRW